MIRNQWKSQQHVIVQQVNLQYILIKFTYIVHTYIYHQYSYFYSDQNQVKAALSSYYELSKITA